MRGKPLRPLAVILSDVETPTEELPMNKFAILIAAAGMIGLAALPAQAQEVRVPVDYADLDLGSEQGAAALASRIEARVTAVCARTTDSRDLRAVPQCRAELLANAVEQLHGMGAPLAAANLEPRA
jgi:UrcA family protein